MDGEVTRVEAVAYLQGASGHAVLSTLFLLVAAVVLALGRFGAGLVAVVVAYGVSMNGLSIYAWDEFRERLESRFRRDGDGPSRTLTPHRVSAEMKAELVSSFLIIAGLVASLGGVGLLLSWTDLRTVLYLGAAGLVAGNVCALGLSYVGAV